MYTDNEYGDNEDVDIGKSKNLPEISSPSQQGYGQSLDPNVLDKDVDSDEEGNLMIDDSRGRSIKRSKTRSGMI
jgi:hypothetical protein